ncbi:ABC transporter substrate-binding protein [Leisingera thetidis]|uniref:ABC transporter substrate-binding protein n=1 Tax=Leisingera thetidis TaxID=2930199 RepID=UPI0021F6FE30|nr:Fe(3+) dicitrate ABC transporter substrate-binding protein [Leisingera thetidis]
MRTSYGPGYMRCFILAVVLGFAAAAAQAREVVHALGTAQVPDAPQRIVVLEFSFLDALAAAGLVPVGIADDNKPERIQPVLRDLIGDNWTSVGTRKTPSLEVIAALQPDLIIADTARHGTIRSTLEQIAPVIFYDSLTGGYEDVLSQAARIGEAVGRDEEMAAFQTGHAARMNAIREQIAPAADDRPAQFGVAGSRGLWLHSPQSYAGTLLSALGFEAAGPVTEGGSYGALYQPVTLEQLSETDPAVLILGKPGKGDTIDQAWASETLWQQLEAVRKGHVFEVSSDLWSRSRGMLTAEQSAADLLAIAKSLQ